jgi:release factor glutamine methyltransferase
MNSIGAVLSWARTLLPNIEAESLLAHVLKKNRAYLYTYPESIIPNTELGTFKELVTERATGVPLAYLTKTREFWSLELEVNESTLIPRHETELLVELALSLLPEEKELNVLDLGTGSGAIALALASERPHWHIHACDLSSEALAVASRNVQRLNIQNVSLHQSNWFASLPRISFDAIVSNPPYIAKDDPHLLMGDLVFEPSSALVSGEDGLSDIKYILLEAYQFLLPQGLILIEHGYSQKNLISTIIKKLGYQNPQCWQDLLGHDRVSGGWKP